MIRQMLQRKLLLCCMLVLSATTACSAGNPEVELKGETFTVDLAVTREDQMRGLMFVEEMPAGHGMLFIFPGETRRSFWMKNTRIPLDIMYFDSDLTLVSVSKNARPCIADPCPSYPSAGPAQYVLELNAGEAERLGVERGDPLQLLFEP